jgi:hypothetical protein
MSGLGDQLTARRSRVAIQVAAALTVLAAVGLALIDDSLTRALSAALVGLVALIGVKIALIGLINARRAVARLDKYPSLDARARELALQLDELGRRLDALEAELARTAIENQRLGAEIEPLAMLTRRTEPAIAEFSVLRHEVLYLRENLDRLTRSGDVS